MNITPELKTSIREIIEPGLVSGVGDPEPGKLCVEAAICLALGEPHGDKPTCVAEPDRRFAIRVNDARWPSNHERATAMLPLALAQLGTAGTDRMPWIKRVVEGTIRRVVPIALRYAAEKNPKHADALNAAADRCAAEGTREAADNARSVARSAAAYAAGDAAAAADAAAYAADAADAAGDAAYAADAAAAADAADAAAWEAIGLKMLQESVAVALDAYAAEGRMP